MRGREIEGKRGSKIIILLSQYKVVIHIHPGTYTVVFWAIIHVPHFKGSLPYK